MWGGVLGAVLVLVGSAVMAGCSGGDSESATSRSAFDEDLREPGTLSVCSDMTRPPIEYRDSAGRRHGFEVDVMNEIARRLDLRLVWVGTSRSEIVPALVEGRCDAAASTLPARLDVGIVGRIAAVKYLAVPVSLLVRDGERELVATGLCGRRIGAYTGTHELELLREYARDCEAAGRPRLRIAPIRRNAAGLEQLRAGRIDGLLDELPVTAWYARRQTDRFDLASTLADEDVQWAIGSGIERTGLYVAIRGALLELHHDGTFGGLLDEWGLERAGAVPLPLPG